ncbi:MAG TPA: SDR family NAD(P)-dependent oxidoreductase [Pyrinomonadaceae bacterium]
MARVFITGSADGLGLLAANALIAQGHQVVLHARNEKRGQEALDKAQGAEGVVTGDLSNIDQTKELASKVNDLGKFDAVIHNAGIYNAPAEQIATVNVLAPYALTCLIERPERLIYLTSGMHLQGSAKLENLKTGFKGITYSDSKLQVLMLCKAIARRWPMVYSNAVDPGWVPTKMGGPGATGNLQKGYETQVWLAISSDPKALVSGRYFHHQAETRPHADADDITLQERLLELCSEITGVPVPEV